MYRVDKIADLMVEEALDRPRGKNDIPAALATVRIEVMAIIMDFAAEKSRTKIMEARCLRKITSSV